jgi:putative transposase
MREMGIASIALVPNLSKRNHEHKIYPYLLRGLRIERFNQVRGIDITHILLVGDWMHLVAIRDLSSRCVVALDLNTDQGSHFTSPHYTQRILAAEVLISMDGRGRAMDNIFTERLWRSLKHEEVYLKKFLSLRQARQGIDQYLSFYNHERPHQSLDYHTPAEFHFRSSLR